MVALMSLIESHGPEAKSLYEEGWTMPQIAKKFGVSYPTVRTTLIKLGTVIRASNGGAGKRRPGSDLFTESQVEEIRVRLESGENMASIGRAMGTSQTTIDRYAKRLGLHVARKQVLVKAADIVADYTAGASADVLATKYDTTRSSIYSILDRAGAKASSLRSESYERNLSAAGVWSERLAKYISTGGNFHDLEFRKSMAEEYASTPARESRPHAKIFSSFQKAGCKRCGESHGAVLEAHHRDPSTKLFSLGTAPQRTAAELELELAKCDCLCANCHRLHHYEEYCAKVGQSTEPEEYARHRGSGAVRAVLGEFHSTGCWLCGEKHPAKLSAHHVYPKLKSFSISTGTAAYSAERVKAELSKCACLCETCHRLVHAGVLECPKEPAQARAS